jgi:hypothetical protein
MVLKYRTNFSFSWYITEQIYLSIGTGHWLDGRGTAAISGSEGDFSLHSAKTFSGTYPSTYTKSIGRTSSRYKAAGA